MLSNHFWPTTNSTFTCVLRCRAHHAGSIAPLVSCADNGRRLLILYLIRTLSSLVTADVLQDRTRAVEDRLRQGAGEARRSEPQAAWGMPLAVACILVGGAVVNSGNQAVSIAHCGAGTGFMVEW
jgi:hypothetical protein